MQHVFLYENCLINKFVLLLFGMYGHIADGGSKQALPCHVLRQLKPIKSHLLPYAFEVHFGFLYSFSSRLQILHINTWVLKTRSK